MMCGCRVADNLHDCGLNVNDGIVVGVYHWSNTVASVLLEVVVEGRERLPVSQPHDYVSSTVSDLDINGVAVPLSLSPQMV